MATTTLLDLPTELLDKVCSYLDWDRSKELTPTRPNIINISLTCGHLREAVLPTLFRNVHLKIRWVDGALVEPGLVKMRKHAPHLAKHVRCVSMKTLFGQFADPAFKLKPFAVPDEVEEWWGLAPSTASNSQTERELSHRQQVNEAARALFEDPEYAPLVKTCTGELRMHAAKLIRRLFGDASYVQSWREPLGGGSGNAGAREILGDSALFDEGREVATQSAQSSWQSRRRRYRDLRLRLDALVLVILCLPVSLNALVFESLPTDRMDTLQHAFALQIVAMTMKIFSIRIQSITTLSAGSYPMRDEHGDLTETKILNSDIISNLQQVRELVLSSNHSPRHRSRSGDLHHGWKRWHTISANITSLSFCNTDHEPHELVELVKDFTSLQNLTMRQVVLQLPWNVTRQGNGPTGPAVWLTFLIELRRLVPSAAFHLHEIQDYRTQRMLPRSALRFLLEQGRDRLRSGGETYTGLQ